MPIPIIIQDTDAVLDDKQITVMGISRAGWGDYKKRLATENVRVYSTTSYVINEDSQSIYMSTHGKDTWEIRSNGKKKNPLSVQAALSDVADILISLKEIATMRAITQYIVADVYKKEISADIIIILKNIEKAQSADEKQAEIINLFSKLIDTCGPDPENLLDEDGEPVDLRGYNFSRNLKYEIDACLQGEDKGKLESLKKHLGYVDINASAEDMQATLDQSKRMITDTLQYNLQMLQENKPLVPIHFVISSDAISGIADLFEPNWSAAVRKQGFIITNAELRMTYKLMQELNDPLINEVMEKTVSFYKRTVNNEFKEIPSPWNDDMAAWNSRTRTENKPAYKDRQLALQPWIQQFKALSEKTATVLNAQKISYKK